MNSAKLAYDFRREQRERHIKLSQSSIPCTSKTEHASSFDTEIKVEHVIVITMQKTKNNFRRIYFWTF